MKSRIYLIAVTIVLAALFSNASAQNVKEDNSIATKFQQVLISYDMKDLVTVEYVDAFAEGPWKMKVRVYEESGKLLFSRVLRKKGDARVGFDIAQFPAGNYTFELYKNREPICSKVIVKQPSIANTDQEAKPKSNISKFQQVQISYDKNDMVTLEYVDAFAEGPWKMKVRVYEETGKLLYSRVIRKDGDARIGYDISQFPDGNYTFELYKNGESVYSKVIVKQASIANADKDLNFIAQEDAIK